MSFIRKDDNRSATRVNRVIKARTARVIDHEGKQLGIMDTRDALKVASDLGLDLVEVSPSADPPVCKIMDYGKYKYRQSKRAQTAKKKQSVIVVKEVRFRPRTEDHNLQVKLRSIRKFLLSGHKVKVFIMFRGREMAHTELGAAVLERVAEESSDNGFVEQKPKQEGRRMTMLIAPLKTNHN